MSHSIRWQVVWMCALTAISGSVLQNQPSIGARFRVPIQTLAYLLIV